MDLLGNTFCLLLVWNAALRFRLKPETAALQTADSAVSAQARLQAGLVKPWFINAQFNLQYSAGIRITAGNQFPHFIREVVERVTWVWVKIQPPGDRRWFWSMFPLTRVPFGVPIFDPQPLGVRIKTVTAVNGLRLRRRGKKTNRRGENAVPSRPLADMEDREAGNGSDISHDSPAIQSQGACGRLLNQEEAIAVDEERVVLKVEGTQRCSLWLCQGNRRKRPPRSRRATPHFQSRTSVGMRSPPPNTRHLNAGDAARAQQRVSVMLAM